MMVVVQKLLLDACLHKLVKNPSNQTLMLIDDLYIGQHAQPCCPCCLTCLTGLPRPTQHW
jgi:hypothetical protein